MRISGKRWGVAVAVATLSLVFAGCAGGGSDPQITTDPVAGEPQPGGTLTYIVTGETPSMDPAKIQPAASAGGAVGAAIFDVLLYIDPASGEVEPKLAESFAPDETGKIWTLRLREGMEFSDGSPFDAEAVKFNWERMADPDLASIAASVVAQIETMTVAGPTELIVELNEPDVFFDRAVAWNITVFIASPESLRSADVGTTPVGAGPFVLDEWVRDSTTRLSRNPGYYDAPRPYVDELVIRVMPDTSQSSSMLRSGQADVGLFQNKKDTTALVEDGLDVETILGPGSPALALNMTKAPFDDARVREAVRLAIDIDQAAEVVGTFGAIAAPFPEGSPYNYGMAFPAPDAAKAQALFDEYSAETGETITFSIGAFQESGSQSEAEFLQSVLNGFDNVEVSVSVQPSAQAIGDVFSKNFEAYLWGQPVWAAADLEKFLSSTSFVNVSGFNSSEIDAAFLQAKSTTDEEVQNDAFEFVVRTMIEQVPTVVYGVRENSAVHLTTVHGIQLHSEGTPFFEKIWKTQ